MLKKLVLALCLLSSSLSFASSYKAPAVSYKIPVSVYKGGPYLGGGLGIQNTAGYTGLYGTVFGGYNVLVGERRNLYLAGEIFGNTGTIPLSQTYYRRTTYGAGLSFLPGLILQPGTLIYLRMGVALFQFNLNNSRFIGGQLGLGLQNDLSANWALRGEYVYTGRGIFQNFGSLRFNFFNLALLYKFK